MSKSRNVLIGCAVLWMGIGVAELPRGATLMVFAAASLSDSLKEIAVHYQSRSGDRVVFNFSASSFLARQIEEGAQADIFFSADEAKMDQLEKNGFIDKTTRRSLLSNSLVVVVASDNRLRINSAADLAGDAIKRIGLADPKTVPAGIYAKQYLENAGVWNAVRSKVVPLDNVRAALSSVESGDVDAGIVYKTDAQISRKVKVAYQVPRNEAPAISYPVAAIKSSAHGPSDKQFLDFLGSSEARAIFTRFGFNPID